MTLERIEHKVFASEAPLDEMGQFGSALATTKLNTKDVAEIQALPAYTKGWGSAIISENNYPAMEEMNGVLNVMSYHTGYLYQEGIPTYSATQEYSATSWVKDLVGEKVYKSLQGGNKGHDLTDSAWWEELKLGGGGLEIGDIGIAPLGIDETKGKRRYLNGQLIIQEQYVQFTNKVKSAIALYPSLACTESEWQTTATMTVGGQVGKFVIDDDAGTIRLPKIIMPIQGLTDLSKLGEIVEAGLPNITAYAKSFGDGASGFSTNMSGAFWAPTVNQLGHVKGTNKYDSCGEINFDASRSNPIYSNSKTVQQEQIQYPYFIQVATGAETEDNIINEIELNNPFSLLDYKYSEYQLNNASWLRSNGQYNSKAVYPAVYDLLLKIYNGTETKAGVSVKLSTGSYSDTDFVLNTANETFRLPIKVKQNFYDNIAPVAGNGLALGLNTSNGDNGLIIANNYFTVGKNAFGAVAGEVVSPTDEYPAQLSSIGLTTDSSKSGIEAHLTENTGLYLYFYVGETVQNANLINAGRIEEKLVDIQGELVDVRNEKLDKSVVKAYITQTYAKGTSGYNLYSNGYCEQWGFVNITASSHVITLLKSYNNTNYNILIASGEPSNDTGGFTGGNGVVQPKEAGSFKCSTNTAWQWLWWTTKGYIS